MNFVLSSVPSKLLLASAMIVTSGGIPPEWADFRALLAKESLETQRYEVRFLEATECCPSRLRFEVEKKARPRVPRELVLEARVQDYHGIMITAESKLLIAGRLRYGGWIFLVVDLEKVEPHDELWSYGFKFSPSKRYLAYRTHYPPHGLPISRRSIVVVYDFALSKAENHIGKSDDRTTGAHGFPVFPEKNVEEVSYLNILEDAHGYLSPFLWSDDEKMVVFVEIFSEKYFLVAIDLANGLRSPKIRRRPLRVEDFLTPEAAARFSKEDLEEQRLLFCEVAWKDADTVTLTPYPDFDLREKVDVHLPEPGG